MLCARICDERRGIDVLRALDALLTSIENDDPGCPGCADLEERLRCQAATNLALVKECDRYRAQALEADLRELVEAPAMDMRVRDALVRGE
jgi:hypothetical protein